MVCDVSRVMKYVSCDVVWYEYVSCDDVVHIYDAMYVFLFFVSYNLDLTPYPTLVAIDARLAELPAFKAAHADAQVDAVKA